MGRTTFASLSVFTSTPTSHAFSLPALTTPPPMRLATIIRPQAYVYNAGRSKHYSKCAWIDYIIKNAKIIASNQTPANDVTYVIDSVNLIPSDT